MDGVSVSLGGMVRVPKGEVGGRRGDKGRTTATRVPIWKPRLVYSSSPWRDAASGGSATTVPAASIPRIWGKALMGYRPFLHAGSRCQNPASERHGRERHLK